MEEWTKEPGLSWDYDSSTRTLRIDGCGDMPSLWNDKAEAFGKAPWASFKHEIENVVVGDLISSISSGLFHGYKALRFVKATGVIEIRGGAFYECEALEEVEIGSLSIIGAGAFQNCVKLRKVASRRSKPALKSASVRFIDDYAFARCIELEKVSLPNVKAVGDGAFFRCASIVSFIMDQLRFAGELAFRECASVEKFKCGEGCVFGRNAFEKSPIEGI